MKIETRNSKLALRIGFGNDIHRLVAGRDLIVGGVLIESELGAEGHSDADVLLHSITDALLGALALGDIGALFSDTDPRWKNADSRIFLREAVRMIQAAGFRVANVDSTIGLEKPKLRPYIERMRQNLAEILKVEIDSVSVKAKTGESVDAVGERRAINAFAVVLLQKIV